MDGVRRFFGVDASLPEGVKREREAKARVDKLVAERRTKTSDVPHSERLAAEAQNARRQAEFREEEAADLDKEGRELLAKGDRKGAQAKITDAVALRKEAETWRAKQRNLVQQQSRIDSSKANVEAALLAGEGADELEAEAAVLDAIDVDETMERLRGAAHRAHQHDRAIARDVFADPYSDTDERVETELAAMEAELGLVGLSDLPTVPVRESASSASPSTPLSVPRQVE